MDNLDLLIKKFQEAKSELQKTEDVEGLDKASPAPYGFTAPIERVKTPPVASAAVGRFGTPAVPKATAAKTLVAEDKQRAATGNATVSKGEDKDARWAEKMKNFNKAEGMEKTSAAGIRGGQARMLPNVAAMPPATPPATPATPPASPATPPVRSAAGVRGGTARMLPSNVRVGDAASIRGTPAGQVKQMPRDVPKVGDASGVRGTLMRSEEVVKFDENGQWRVNKAVNEATGTPNASLSQSEDEDKKKDEETEKMDSTGGELTRGC